MAMPVIDFSELQGENRAKTMALLHNACRDWGFFEVENHGIDIELMEKVKDLMNRHYEENMKDKFYASAMATRLDNLENAVIDADWESAFFIWHRPDSNIQQLNSLSVELRNAMDEYINQLIKLAETLSELLSENLGLDNNHIKQAFSGGRDNDKSPAVGTKVAIYPKCSRSDAIRGLREHTDAGGIILLLQDDQVPGLEFLKDGEWIKIPPSKNNKIFVNTGDQVEVISNGIYKSRLHRVMTDTNGSRLSIATFYNPNGDSIISPAKKVLYPDGFIFKDYLKLYSETKFSDKAQRFELMKKPK